MSLVRSLQNQTKAAITVCEGHGEPSPVHDKAPVRSAPASAAPSGRSATAPDGAELPTAPVSQTNRECASRERRLRAAAANLKEEIACPSRPPRTCPSRTPTRSQGDGPRGTGAGPYGHAAAEIARCREESAGQGADGPQRVAQCAGDDARAGRSRPTWRRLRATECAIPFARPRGACTFGAEHPVRQNRSDRPGRGCTWRHASFRVSVRDR